MTKGEQDSHINGNCNVSTSIADQLYENTSDDNESHKQASGDEQKVVTLLTVHPKSGGKSADAERTRAVRRSAAKCALVAKKVQRRVARSKATNKVPVKSNGQLAGQKAVAAPPPSLDGRSATASETAVNTGVSAFRVKSTAASLEQSSSQPINTTNLRRSQRLNSTGLFLFLLFVNLTNFLLISVHWYLLQTKALHYRKTV